MKPWQAFLFMAMPFLIGGLALLYLTLDYTGPYEPLPTPYFYVVVPNDTLWQIAERYYPDADPREVVDAIRELNDVEPHRLRPNDVLILPTAVKTRRGRVLIRPCDELNTLPSITTGFSLSSPGS